MKINVDLSEYKEKMKRYYDRYTAQRSLGDIL
jgi:hypothetical protein